MKTTLIRSFLVAAMLAMAAVPFMGSTPAVGQSQPPIVVGVVDWDAIMRDSKAAKGIKAALDKQKAAFEADIGKQEKTLRDAEQKLGAQRASLAEEEFKAKVQDLDKQARALRQSIQQKQNQLQDSFRKSMDQVRETLLQVVADIAKARKLTLVLNKSDVVLSHNDYDFTKEAMGKLDAKLPAVSLK